MNTAKFLTLLLLGSFTSWDVAFCRQMKPVLNDWFALGSGCRAKHDLAGNVTADARASSSPNQYGMVYTLKDFSFNETHGKPGQSKFARECSIRLNINPPPGMIIKTLKARTSFDIAKKSSVALNLYTELKLGSTSLGTFRKEYQSKELVSSEKLDLNLLNDNLPLIIEPKLNCGDPKIIALDISWMGEKDDKLSKPGETFNVTLGQNSQVSIEATLEPCQSK